MTERGGPAVRGLPDGGAELTVVLSLRWEDVAALGREASRLAEQRGAPVTLDEAASHRLRTWSSVANGPEPRTKAAPAGPSPAVTAPDRSRPHVAPLGETAPMTALASSPTAGHGHARPPATTGGGPT
ncbi:hypothetical protein NRO40_02280 [Streptomyces changanensis]|uniref:Uncharacterized protein n=1 Tax=Streptomyces changanensis TaxID=2964669 RepID=A0ABY5MZR4_9ACTN|nr:MULTISPECIES: hypothetical protein [Streptomyces]UUS29777.1 hypothetical protein NRO40_02280 [Streptomyces changanensis]